MVKHFGVKAALVTAFAVCLTSCGGGGGGGGGQSGHSLVNVFGFSDNGLRGPAFAQDGTIYFSHFDEVQAINKDFTPKWTTGLSRTNGTPVVRGDGVIYVETYSTSPSFTTLNAIDASGTLLWSVNDGTTLAYRYGCFDNSNRFYCGSTADNSLHCFNTSGGQLWTYSTGGNIWNVVPLPGIGVVFASNDAGVYALNSAGALLWKYQLAAPGSPGQISMDSLGNTYITDAGGTLVSIDSGGHQRWSSFVGSPGYVSVSGSRLTVASGQYLYGYSTSGARQWAYHAVSIFGVPLLSSDGRTLVPNNDGLLYEFDSAGHKLSESAMPGSGSLVQNVIGQTFLLSKNLYLIQ